MQRCQVKQHVEPIVKVKAREHGLRQRGSHGMARAGAGTDTDMVLAGYKATCEQALLRSTSR